MGEGPNGKHWRQKGRQRFRSPTSPNSSSAVSCSQARVTEEVWALARNMSGLQSAATVGIVAAVGYASLYKAAPDRDSDREADVGGVPLRFLSLMTVSFGAVAVLAVTLGAPATFLDDLSGSERVLVTLRAISIGAIFSVVGAATADSLY